MEEPAEVTFLTDIVIDVVSKPFIIQFPLAKEGKQGLNLKKKNVPVFFPAVNFAVYAYRRKNSALKMPLQKNSIFVQKSTFNLCL